MSAALRRSNDRKVANSLTGAGRSRIPNAFGLPAGSNFSCAGMTTGPDGCEGICYAGKLELAYPALLPVLMGNWDLLKDADHTTMVRLLTDMVDDFEADCRKWSAPQVFRIHWDGDFFSEDYAAAWAVVIRRHPDTKFWAYTRVEDAWRLLFHAELPNLALYFSGDPVNADIAHQIAKEGGRVAMLGKTFEQAARTLGAKTQPVQCPELKGRIPLAGACVACGACIRGRSNITFSTTKR